MYAAGHSVQTARENYVAQNVKKNMANVANKVFRACIGVEDNAEDIEGVAPNLGPEYEAKRAKMQEEVYQQNINNFLQKQDRLDQAPIECSHNMHRQQLSICS